MQKKWLESVWQSVSLWRIRRLFRPESELDSLKRSNPPLLPEITMSKLSTHPEKKYPILKPAVQADPKFLTSTKLYTSQLQHMPQSFPCASSLTIPAGPETPGRAVCHRRRSAGVAPAYRQRRRHQGLPKPGPLCRRLSRHAQTQRHGMGSRRVRGSRGRLPVDWAPARLPSGNSGVSRPLLKSIGEMSTAETPEKKTHFLTSTRIWAHGKAEV